MDIEQEEEEERKKWRGEERLKEYVTIGKRGSWRRESDSSRDQDEEWRRRRGVERWERNGLSASVMVA